MTLRSNGMRLARTGQRGTRPPPAADVQIAYTNGRAGADEDFSGKRGGYGESGGAARNLEAAREDQNRYVRTISARRGLTGVEIETLLRSAEEPPIGTMPASRMFAT